MNKEQRYIVVEESISSHCCFNYTVVDIEGGKEFDMWNVSLCETFEKKYAYDICEALNKQS